MPRRPLEVVADTAVDMRARFCSVLTRRPVSSILNSYTSEPVGFGAQRQAHRREMRKAWKLQKGHALQPFERSRSDAASQRPREELASLQYVRTLEEQ